MQNPATLTTPEAAEHAFYAAFEAGDVETMMAIWETSLDVVCIHPLGPRLHGATQIREGWRRIFSTGTRLHFQITGMHSFAQSDLAVRVVYEQITVLGASKQPNQPVIATNVYRRTANGWRIVLHHASPGPALTERQPHQVH